MANNGFHTVAEIVRLRQTTKVIAKEPIPIAAADSESFERDLQAAIEGAGWAPFHFDRAVDGIPEPWRVHTVSWQDCRLIAAQFSRWFGDIKPGNKLPGMLNACGALILVTWLPHGDAEIVDPGKREEVNLEHQAAAAAYVQNLLLLLTAQGHATYWSSGGQLKTPAAFRHLSLPDNQRLLAAIFVENPVTRELPLERVGGKMRSVRAPANHWCRPVKISLDSPATTRD